MAPTDNKPNISEASPTSQNTEASERTPLIGADNAHGDVHGSSDGGDDGVTSGGVVRQTSTNPQEEETTVISKQLPFGRLAIIMATAWIGVFLGAIDSTVIATLTVPISSEFNSLSLLSWLATAYLISNAACQPISGRLTDIFGRGPGLVFSNIFFAAGNLICGFARDESVMLLGRVIAGIGGGGLMSISTFLASDLVPLRKRGLIQGIGNLCYASGSMLGGVFGGLLNDHTKLGWRLAFIILAPPTLLSAIAVFFLVKVPPKQSDKSYLARIDFFGVLLILAFLILLLLGLNSGGNNVPWSHPLPLTAIPLSLVAFATFLWWESRAKQPIIPVKLLLKRTVLAACLCNFFSTMVTFSGLFYLPLYLQVRGRSATQAGLLLLPSPVGVACGSIASGYIMNKTGKYTKLGIGAVAVMLIGVVLFNFQTESTPLWLPGVAFFFCGGGYGAMLTITLLGCLAAVEHSQQAVVTAATYLARSVGSTLGITISSTVYQNVLKDRLWERFGDYPNAAEEISQIRNSIAKLKHLPEGWYPGVIQSFMDAFHAVFYTLLGVAIVALISISLMKQHTLHSTLERDRDG